MKAAAGNPPMSRDPGGSRLGSREHRLVVCNVVISDKPGDSPPVFASILMRVDTRNPKFAPRRIVERIIDVAVGRTIEIGILAREERAILAEHEMSEVAVDRRCGLEIARIMPTRIGFAVLAQILRLERHDLFEMR